VERGLLGGLDGVPLTPRMTTESTALVLWQPGIPKHQDMRIGNRKAVGVCHIGKITIRRGRFGSHALPEMLLNQCTKKCNSHCCTCPS